MTDNELARSLHQAVALMSRESDQILLEQLGVGLAQYKILTILHESAQTQQRGISLLLGQTEASISRQIKLLEGKGMLLVTRNPANLREHRTQLTVKGLRVIEAAETSLAKYHEGVFEIVGKKQRSQLEEALGLLKP